MVSTGVCANYLCNISDTTWDFKNVNKLDKEHLDFYSHRLKYLYYKFMIRMKFFLCVVVMLQCFLARVFFFFLFNNTIDHMNFYTNFFWPKKRHLIQSCKSDVIFLNKHLTFFLFLFFWLRDLNPNKWYQPGESHFTIEVGG